MARPLFLLAVAGVFLLALRDLWAPGLWLAFPIIAWCGWLAGKWRVCLILMAFGALVIGRIAFEDARQIADEESFAELGSAYVEARLLEDGKGDEGFWSGIVRLHGEDYDGAKVLWSGVGEAPSEGTELSAWGVFSGFEPARNPGELERAEFLRPKEVVAIFQASEMRSQQWMGPVSGLLAGIKADFREGIVAGLDQEGEAAQVIRAVVMGERSDASLELIRHFRESGTLHVFTVSGMHVLMVGSMIWLILKWSGLRRNRAIPVIIAAMFFYTWLTGNGPAATRAAWMGSVFLGAFLLKRRSDLLNSLGAVLIVNLLLNPQIIRMPGVQLSYGVVGSIGLAGGYAGRLFSWISRKEMFLPDSEMGWWARQWYSFRRKLVDALAVSTAAWAGSLFLTAFHFGVVTPISLVATVVLGLQVYFVLGIAMISSVLFPISRTGSVGLNRMNSLMAASCSASARFFSELPGAWMQVGRADEEELIVYDLDYGAGAACFVSSGGGAVMIDSGGKYDLKAVVASSLRNLRISPDSVIFTHEDAGHVAGSELMNQMFRIKQVALVEPDGGTSLLGSWKDSAVGSMKDVEPAAGDVLDLGGGVRAEVVLSPLDQNRGSVADDRVLVMMIHWDDWKVLWMGDAGRLSEEALLASGVDLSADLIVAGMHESDLSLTKPFLKKVNPAAILVARGGGSVMDAFRIQQIRKWQKADFVVVDQSKAGGVTISVENGKMVLDGFLDKSRMALKKR
ncbi:ComEC/Rec2 family competence protein [Luteolibacter sp. AS25]|uniref:ComEC/Rec2 family competence protein n=1 Tax=Luteolibacter sp. AS25 TaxID=3135776 RepID=UPI00398B68FD